MTIPYPLSEMVPLWKPQLATSDIMLLYTPVFASDKTDPSNIKNTNNGGWGLMGNTGTVGGTNFIGTTDAQDFRTFTNNLERMRVFSSGNISIGTITEKSLLYTYGNVSTTATYPVPFVVGTLVA